MSAAALKLVKPTDNSSALDPVPPVPDFERPMDVTVYCIRDGRVGRGTVRSPLPHDIQPGALFEAAPQLPESRVTLEAVREVATRCAPWVRVYMGPELWARAREGQDLSAFRSLRRGPDGWEFELAGRAYSHDTVLLAAFGTSTTVQIFHHELAHRLDKHVHAKDLAAWDAACGHGIDLPGAYLDSLTERRARFYEHWASACDEGWRAASLCGVPLRRVDRIMLYIYSGALAKDVVAGRLVQPRPFPGQRILRKVLRWAREAATWPMPLLYVFVCALIWLRLHGG